MSNSTAIKPENPKSLTRKKERYTLDNTLRRSQFGAAIADFAESEGLSPWQLLDKAGIPRSMIVDSAKREFKSIQVNTLGEILEKLKAIGFVLEDEVLLTLIFAAKN